jgi:flagellin-like hook-associated protein FlgL
MAISPINVARVSQNLRAFNLLETVRGQQVNLFRTQNQLATGLKFQSPSEDVPSATAALLIDRQRDRINQVQENLSIVNGTITSAEAAMDEAIRLMQDARTIALEAAGDTIEAEERSSLAQVVTSIVDEMIAIGNREYLGQYLFSGNRTQESPFSYGLGGVEFRGDAGRRETIVDTDFAQDSFTISGQTFFGAVSPPIVGQTDLNPLVTAQTRIADLRDPVGDVPSFSQLVINDGTTATQVDLGQAATVGDLIDLLNDQMPPTLNATLTGGRIQITGTPGITVSEFGGGRTAQSLGLLTSTPTASILGADLNPIVTNLTQLSDLRQGSGLDLSGGITISNGDITANIDFSTAETVEDVLNLINGAEAGAWAQISHDGRHIDILNRVSGTDLRVMENGGAAAANLGIRTTTPETRLSDLNDGRGVFGRDGDDFTVTTSDGTALTFDVSAAESLQDVIDILNSGGGGAITAELSTNGNGLVITDNTAGVGTLHVLAINQSPALTGLGLDVLATGNQLIGSDVNPVRVDSAFTTLLELERNLRANNRDEIGFAEQRLERTLDQMLEIRGQMAATAKVMSDRVDRLESADTAAQVLRSDVADADMTDAVVQFQQLQTALQANLQSSTQVLRLSLLDFI